MQEPRAVETSSAQVALRVWTNEMLYKMTQTIPPCLHLNSRVRIQDISRVKWHMCGRADKCNLINGTVNCYSLLFLEGMRWWKLGKSRTDKICADMMVYLF